MRVLQWLITIIWLPTINLTITTRSSYYLRIGEPVQKSTNGEIKSDEAHYHYHYHYH